LHFLCADKRHHNNLRGFFDVLHAAMPNQT
jgi:hypothetical protein